MSEIRTAIGLMSGTSMDGIDVALLRTDGEHVIEFGPNRFFPYRSETRKRIACALEEAGCIAERIDRPGNLVEVEQEITDLHAKAVDAFLNENDLSASEINVLGFHGQTVIHRPEKSLTVQLGDGEALARITGIQTVYDMRANDMLHGGQGAPLVPVYHQAMADNLPEKYRSRRPVVFVNVGGISNITYVGAELIAFDSGPGNALIDQWVQKHVGISHDQGGMIGAEGWIDEALLDQYLNHPFFDAPAPKSLDRNDFKLPVNVNSNIETVARTLARLSAESVFKSLEHLPEKPKLWIVSGGGRFNPHIMNDLKYMAKHTESEVITSEDAGFAGDFIEAEAWAYLAVRSLRGLPLTYPQTTGCDIPTTGGIIAK
ncbi:MAG: anhydro-N-acetylmuramic acid kinase [Rhizobiaceae bacterium]